MERDRVQAQGWYSKETNPNPLLNQKKVEESIPRKKRTPNKTTADSKKVLVEILEGQSSNLEFALKDVFQSYKRAYLRTISKLLTFILPKGSVDAIEDGTKG